MRKVTNIRTPHFLMETERGEEFGRIQIDGHYYGATVQLATGELAQSGSSSLALSTFVAGFGLACIFPDTAPSAPVFVIIATDSAGDSWIAGRGDDCRAAWEGAQIPPDWREIVCIEGRPGQ